MPKLYQLLSNAIEADDASRSGLEGNTGPGSTTESIRAVLHEAPWLWVGDGFVPADQVRLSFRLIFFSLQGVGCGLPDLFGVTCLACWM